MENYKIAVAGTGYVGLSLSVLLAQHNQVMAVDIVQAKVDMINNHKWMRAKWSAPIRKYWKISEQMMVKYCDLAICDSVNIEKYIHECYDGKGIKGRNPKTTFIAYGADLTLSKLADDDEKLVNHKKNTYTEFVF